MGCHWKRLIKAVKNFEIFFRLGLTLPSGTPAKGPRDPRKPTFFKRSKMWRVGFRLKCLVKLVKNFNFFAVSASPGPQGPCQRVPKNSIIMENSLS